jgi:hypothetical protein
MYDVQETLAHIDDHKWAVIALGAGALVLNFVFFWAALRQAQRDRVYSVPVFTTLFWLCGDSSFLWHYDRWFNTYDHWYPKLFWVGLVVTMLFEVAFLVQIIRYGRKELFPWGSQAQFTVLVLFALGAAIVTWSMIRHVIGDGLWITYFGLASIAGPLAAAALISKRRSRAGQNPLIWIAYTGMVMCWFTAEILWFGPTFHGAEFIATGIVTIAASAGVAWAVTRLPEYVPEPDPRDTARGPAPAPAAVSVTR